MKSFNPRKKRKQKWLNQKAGTAFLGENWQLRCTSLTPETTRDHGEPELKEASIKNSLPFISWHRLNTDEVSAHTRSFVIQPVLLMCPQINYTFLWSWDPILVMFMGYPWSTCVNAQARHSINVFQITAGFHYGTKGNNGHNNNHRTEPFTGCSPGNMWKLMLLESLMWSALLLFIFYRG